MKWSVIKSSHQVRFFNFHRHFFIPGFFNLAIGIIFEVCNDDDDWFGLPLNFGHMSCQQFRQTCVSFNLTWGLAILLIHFVSNIFALAKLINSMFYVHMNSCFTPLNCTPVQSLLPDWFTLLKQLYIYATSSPFCRTLPMSSCFEWGMWENDGNNLACSVLLGSKSVRKPSALKIEK